MLMDTILLVSYSSIYVRAIECGRVSQTWLRVKPQKIKCTAEHDWVSPPTDNPLALRNGVCRPIELQGQPCRFSTMDSYILSQPGHTAAKRVS